MAITKAKRSAHRAQPPRRPSIMKTFRRRKFAPFRKLVRFPQAKGKTIEDVEFSTCSDYHNISINFQDKTALNFSIETGFTVKTDHSDWKSGNQRLLHVWTPIRNK